MTTEHGIYEFDGSELGAPGPDFFAPLTDSIEAAFGDVDDQIAAIPTQADSGWVDITSFGTGWGATPGHDPRVRRVGDRVEIAGAVTRASASGLLTGLLTIPVGFRLAGEFGAYFIGSSVTSDGRAVELFMGSNGILQIPGSYYTAAPGTTNVVVPLTGSWFIN